MSIVIGIRLKLLDRGQFLHTVVALTAKRTIVT